MYIYIYTDMHAHAVHLPLNPQVDMRQIQSRLEIVIEFPCHIPIWRCLMGTHQRIPVFILEWDHVLTTWTKIASLLLIFAYL